MPIGQLTRSPIRERLRRLLGGAPRRVQAAALPWRAADTGIEVMLVTSRGTGRWILPKGWPEGNERLFEAAAREAREEAGVTGAVAHRELGRYHYAKRKKSGVERRCEVAVFPLAVEQAADEWPERKKRTRQWFSPREAAALVRERDLGELIAAFGVNPRDSAS